LADTLLAYRFSDGGRNFVPPLNVAIDSDECVAACLFGSTLKPGDVEEEFVDGYSPRQREWMETNRVDELYGVVRDVRVIAIC
jgi:hypothetical protein